MNLKEIRWKGVGWMHLAAVNAINVGIREEQ
jgi:hypothetical protein